MSTFVDRYGPWAVVAGGSEGIGAAYARELAAAGCHLVLIGLGEDPLVAVAHQLRARHGVQVRTLDLDLGRDDLLEVLRPVIADCDVGLLVYNAAVSPIGEFVDVPLERLLAAVDVNVRGPLVLAHEIGRRLVDRGRGGIVLMSSLASSQGSAMVATYGATKAFNRILGEGLWEELGRRGVDVVAVTPGTTDTPGLRASQPRGGPRPMPAQAVARAALAGLGQGPVVVPGWQNRLSGILTGRLLPRRTAIRMVSGVTRKMYRR